MELAAILTITLALVAALLGATRGLKGDARVVDAETILHDSDSQISSSAVGQVDGSDQVVDLGEADVQLQMVVDVHSLKHSAEDEEYTLILEGCNTEDFSTGSPDIAPLATLPLHHGSEHLGESNVDGPTGRHILPVNNRYGEERYRFVRLNRILGGTSPEMEATAFLTRDVGIS